MAESDAAEEAAEKKAHPPTKVEAPKALPQKKANYTEEPIPMDNAAIEAYSGVIADAAEDSTPEKAVVYTETDAEKTAQE